MLEEIVEAIRTAEPLSSTQWTTEMAYVRKGGPGEGTNVFQIGHWRQVGDSG